MTRVLVTGATGFVGGMLCSELLRAGYQVRAALRRPGSRPESVKDSVVVGEVCSSTDWTAALRGIDCVIHLAARAHVVHDARENERLYDETNASGTQALAAHAARANVRRFVYLSSVKVNGEEAIAPYRAADEPRPQDAYGLSKWRGEANLTDAAVGTAMEPVIVRPPLVYGPGVRANFLRLMTWIDSGWPLPLGGIVNRRSLISLWNLCDVLANVVSNPAAPGRVWMVTDGEDLSTPELIRRIARAMRRRVRLLPVPATMLQAAGAVVGLRAEMRRLCGSLSLETSDTRAELHWRAPLSVDESIERTVRWYLAEGRNRRVA